MFGRNGEGEYQSVTVVKLAVDFCCFGISAGHLSKFPEILNEGAVPVDGKRRRNGVYASLRIEDPPHFLVGRDRRIFGDKILGPYPPVPLIRRDHLREGRRVRTFEQMNQRAGPNMLEIAEPAPLG